MERSKSTNKNLIRLILLGLFIFSSCSKAEDSIILIPNEYNGPIKIYLDQENGTEVKYEGDKRLYEISKNGILRTKFTSQSGFYFTEYYYVTENGERTKIYALLLSETIPDSLDVSKTYAYNFLSMGEVVKIDSIGNVREKSEPGISFMVGNPSD